MKRLKHPNVVSAARLRSCSVCCSDASTMTQRQKQTQRYRQRVREDLVRHRSLLPVMQGLAAGASTAI